ncbi:MAG: YifB family Mg chelatase-like AAA ATPase [Deltaproteobacteria bacterium]|nr:YifB family Mg chelatase-like AAA ATPase [Deltaproteobacteria bacterium]
MLAKVYACAMVGIDTQLVEVEVDVQMQGLPGWSMVGLLETAVKEARDRVSSAIRNSGYKLLNRRTIVNLSPGHVKKSGVHFDLAIAIGMLTAWDVCTPPKGRRLLLAGELSLTGQLLPIPGALLMSICARDHQLDGIILPQENVEEAQLVSDVRVYGISTLADAVALINHADPKPSPRPTRRPASKTSPLDFAEVRGQATIKRGLEIAAAGNHHVLMVGPPGSGKTMLAERLPSILPPLTPDEKLETMKMLSLHGLLRKGDAITDNRPFRAPHHSASYVGLIGGGNQTPRLGEISLAHNGVLFLDELGEFHRHVLEELRQPLESGMIRIVRSGLSLTYPARFMLVSAMNPCPCGYLGHPRRPCVCSVSQIHSYRRRISGPILDRIDLHLEVEPVSHHALMSDAKQESSSAIRDRIMIARERQRKRLGNSPSCNAHICSRDLKRFCTLTPSTSALLEQATEKLLLSARAVHRVLKVARTIADLEGSEAISAPHLAEALHFRPSEINGHPIEG